MAYDEFSYIDDESGTTQSTGATNSAPIQEPVGFVSTATVHSDQSRDGRHTSHSAVYHPQPHDGYDDDDQAPERPRNYKRIAIIAACAVTCGILGVLVSHLMGGNSEPEVVVRDVQTAVVVRKDFEDRLEASGPVEPKSTTNVASEIDGVVESIEVTEGQKVKEGDVLITLKNDTLEHAVNDAQRSVDTAQLALDTAKSNAESARKALDEARNVYKRARIAYEEDLAEYEELIEGADLEEPVAPEPIDESQATEEEKAEYQQLYDEYVRALVNYNSAMSSAASAVKPQEPTIDETSLQSAIQSADKAVESADLNLNNARKVLDEATKTADKRTIKAPTDGTVTDILAKVGTRVGAVESSEKSNALKASEALVQIGDLNSLVVEAEVPEADLKLIKRGQKAKATFSAVDGVELDAEVTEIASKASGKNAEGKAIFKVKIALSKTDSHIKQGMTATVSILVDTIKDALVVPLSAVEERADGKAVVEVITDPETLAGEVREVTLGVRNESEVVITEGLAEKDEVVVPSAEQEADAEEDKES